MLTDRHTDCNQSIVVYYRHDKMQTNNIIRKGSKGLGLISVLI